VIVIPAIDLKDGKCVRLKQGRMEDATVFDDNPLNAAHRWFKEGVERLHLVDLNGAFAGRPVNASAVASICEAYPNKVIQIGGGIRSLECISEYLSLGVSFVILGTKAVESPDFVREACTKFPGKIIVGIDAIDGYVATDGWAKRSNTLALDLAKEMKDFGVSEIIYTDISKDGMMGGVNIEQTARMANVGLPVIASGGVSSIEDIAALIEVQHPHISGVISGRAIYEGTLDLSKAQQLCDGALHDLS